jgi:hypothetical protein
MASRPVFPVQNAVLGSQDPKNMVWRSFFSQKHGFGPSRRPKSGVGPLFWGPWRHQNRPAGVKNRPLAGILNNTLLGAIGGSIFEYQLGVGFAKKR